VELIGDLERFVASSLYPNRAAIAIVCMVAIVGLELLARRRGWFGLARRHPIRTAGIAVVLIVVLGPATWYLASPLFISTSLLEAAPPTAAPAAAVAPRSIAPATEIPSTSGDPVPVVPSDRLDASARAATPPPERKGTFVGADEFHFGSGTARLIEGTDGGWTLRFEDFAVRNGPDLYVYLSTRSKRYADGALELGRLKADTGAFNYRLPAGVDPADYRSVVIWCKQFAVQFAHASLTP
jgi:hypothetical protein